MVLLRPKWVAGHLLALLLASAFVTAGFWQIARNDEAHTKLEREKRAFAAPAPDIATVDVVAGAATDRRVSVAGEYDARHQALLRNRSRGGKAGFDVMTPLRLDGDRAVLVDRGWVSLDDVERGHATAGVPGGRVVVRGPLQRATPLRAGETVTTEGGVASLPRVDTTRIATRAGYTLLPAYVRAEYQDPQPAAGAPALPDPRPTSEVNHISYAIQWFSFAAIAIVGWPIVLWRATRRRRPRPHDAAVTAPA
jgi:surfeit locus 1 family protein